MVFQTATEVRIACHRYGNAFGNRMSIRPAECDRMCTGTHGHFDQRTLSHRQRCDFRTIHIHIDIFDGKRILFVGNIEQNRTCAIRRRTAVRARNCLFRYDHAVPVAVDSAADHRVSIRYKTNGIGIFVMLFFSFASVIAVEKLNRKKERGSGKSVRHAAERIWR